MSDIQPIEIDVYLQRPIPVILTAEDGTKETIHLPRLGTDGLLAWLDEITAENEAFYDKALKAVKLDARQMLDAQYSKYKSCRAVVTDLNVPAQTPAGIRRILTLSLAMTDLPSEKQASVLERILKAGGGVTHPLMVRLSGLFNTTERRAEPTEAEAVAAKAKMAFPGANIPGGDASPLAESGQSTAVPG